MFLGHVSPTLAVSTSLGDQANSVIRADELTYWILTSQKNLKSVFFSFLLVDMQQPLNVMTQSFGAVNLSSPSNMLPVRPQTNPLLGGPMPMNMPGVMTGTMGMAPLGNSAGMSQGMVGMNMNMGMSASGMGLSGTMGMGMPSMAMPSGTVQPKQDAFANFANFSK